MKVSCVLMAVMADDGLKVLSWIFASEDLELRACDL